MCLNRTSEWKVVTISNSQELPLFNFERLDMWCSIIYSVIVCGGFGFYQLWFSLLKFCFPCSFYDDLRLFLILFSVSVLTGWWSCNSGGREELPCFCIYYFNYLILMNFINFIVHLLLISVDSSTLHRFLIFNSLFPFFFSSWPLT